LTSSPLDHLPDAPLGLEGIEARGDREDEAADYRARLDGGEKSCSAVAVAERLGSEEARQT
jgi:hypothetical protein